MSPKALVQSANAFRVERLVALVRGHQVILDRELAALYGVTTRELNQTVSRHATRFPKDFMLTLTQREHRNLKSQSVTSSWGGSRKAPRAFTEQGVAMLSGLLRSARAVKVNIEIMRAFVRLRRMLEQNANLARRLGELERRYDGRFQVVFDAIRKLMAPPEPRRCRIGFHAEATRVEPARSLTPPRSARAPSR